jgi:hypothetical protein
MYSSATFSLGVQLRIPALRIVSLSFFWLSLTTWMIVALGVLHNQWRRAAVTVAAMDIPCPGPERTPRALQ